MWPLATGLLLQRSVEEEDGLAVLFLLPHPLDDLSPVACRHSGGTYVIITCISLIIYGCCAAYGFNLTTIFRKTKQAMTLIFAIQYRRIILTKYGRFLFSMQKWQFLKNTKVIVHGIVKKCGLEVGNGIEPFYVRMYVYNYVLKLHCKN